jgi:hypothetical protein
MGGLFKGAPKPPPIAAPKEIPDAQNQLDIQKKRQKAAANIMANGVPATKLSQQQLQNTTLGA